MSYCSEKLVCMGYGTRYLYKTHLSYKYSIDTYNFIFYLARRYTFKLQITYPAQNNCFNIWHVVYDITLYLDAEGAVNIYVSNRNITKSFIETA